MSYTKQTWQDHVTSRPHTYTETDNGDGTKTLTAAGEVLQQGSAMSAERFNHMEQGIADAHSAVSDLEAATNAALSGKVDKETGKGLSTNDYTTAEKDKLAGLKNYVSGTGIEIENDGTINCTSTVTVDSALSASSENPVQNKKVTSAINELRSVTLYCTLPTQSGTLTYDGSSKSPSWTGYDSAKFTLGGTTSATNVGTYYVTFTPKAPYMWSDGTRTAKSAAWTIGRATGTLTLSETSVSTVTGVNTTVTLTTNSDGTKSASSNYTSRVNATVSGTTVTLTGGSTGGSATVTVSIAQSTNYTAVSKTISVNNIIASSTLSSNTPDVIKAVAQTGQASNLWSVGDKTSGISISGTVGSLSISGTYYAFILGFNHNSSREGSNSIHFALGMTSNGTRIAFCDSKYNNTGSDAAFRMNTSNTNSGGWSSSYMRNTILPAFENAITSSWRNVMASITKYTDNTGKSSDTAPNVTGTTDTLFLLAELEVRGVCMVANSKEQNYQAQYAYFANGNGKIFYKHDATATACVWWLRSAYPVVRDCFGYVTTDGVTSFGSANCSLGVVFGFVIK